MYKLRREQLIPRSRNEVYSFFEKPENLSVITPPKLGFIILTPAPIEIKKGALIDYTIKMLGFRLRLQTEITEYDPPNGFQDAQSKGPYKAWTHRHIFLEHPDGTLMIDEVDYDLPFGRIGKLVHAFVKNELASIFDYRNKKIEAMLKNGSEI